MTFQRANRSAGAPTPHALPPSEARGLRWGQRDWRLSALVFGSGMTATLLCAGLLAFTANERDRQEFETHVLSAEDRVGDRIETSIALLRGAAGLFSSQQDDVTVGSFRAYVERLALRQQYPGLLGIGFSRRVLEPERTALERATRIQGHAGFRIWPRAPDGEHHTIVFLEPMDERNRAAIGYNMYSNDVRRRAMERARDTGQPAASGVVVLVQEIDEQKQPGFLIYLPVYRGGTLPATVAERRQKLVGFAYSPIRAVDFLSSGFAHEPGASISMAVYHGTEPSAATLLYRRAPPEVPAWPRFARRSVIDTAGEPWTIEFRSTSTIWQALTMPTAVAAIGTILSLLLAYFVRREAGARAEVQRLLTSERLARADAEHANRTKDEFLATLSHELRTPLSAIVGWAHVMANERVTPEQIKAGIEAVRRNANAQARLVDDLLDMNRILSGKLRLDVQPLDLTAIIDEAVESVAPAAEAKGLRLRRDIDRDVGPAQGDAARIQQILWNLLSNAIKFTPQGGTVELSARRIGDYLSITVVDSGIGIEPRFLPRVFDRFSQVDPGITRWHRGLGLGLAIVRHLVELHGGSVRAESDGPGRGARFTVDLPTGGAAGRLAPGAAADGFMPSSRSATTTEFDLGGVTVLVVDDERDTREPMRLLLLDCRARVLTAASAAEAFDIIKRESPDVLLSDIAMPETDGYTLMRMIRRYERQHGGHVRAIAFTAFARPEDRAEARRAGFDAHLAKPMRANDVIALIATLVPDRLARNSAVIDA